jgi:hypothetical protein
VAGARHRLRVRAQHGAPEPLLPGSSARPVRRRPPHGRDARRRAARAHGACERGELPETYPHAA